MSRERERERDSKRRVKRLVSLAVVGLAAGITLPAPSVSAASAEYGCSDWGPGGWAGDHLKACLSTVGTDLVGTGQVRDNPGAIMWITICNNDTGECYDRHQGDRVVLNAGDLPGGTYETVFYFGDGSGVQESPLLTLG